MSAKYKQENKLNKPALRVTIKSETSIFIIDIELIKWGFLLHI